MTPREELMALRRLAELEAKAATEPEPTGRLQQLGKAFTDTAAGLVRGAGDIGATLLQPVDMAARALNNGKPVNIGGYDIVGQDRRQGMDAGLREMGANPDALAFKGGRLTSNVAGTLGVGPQLGVAAAASGAAPVAVNALRSAGMTLGPQAPANWIKALALRSGAGGAVGYTSAGMVAPDDANAGGAIGAALPGVLKVGGMLGQGIGGAIKGPAQSPELAQAVQQARSAGYVIPPTQANANVVNRTLEGLSGKITTAQNASAKNSAVTADLAAQAIGLPSGTTITPDVLNSVRKTAGQAYDAVSSAGTIQPGPAYDQALDAITAQAKTAAAGFPMSKPSDLIAKVDALKSPSFDASAAVAKIKELRSEADSAYASGDKGIGKALKSAAGALEDAIEAHLTQTNAPAGMLQGFKNARTLIAKTYSIEKALNPTTGAIDARKLAAQLNKGKPLSGDLRTVAEFANRFPKAAQTVEGMGSLPQTSPLDWGLALGSAVASRGNPLSMAMLGARPLARAGTLSPMVQNRLIQQPASQNAIRGLLSNPDLRQLGYRAAPVIGGAQ